MLQAKKAEALIIGAGPAGTTSALRLLQQGVKPIIVERKAFPRYHIGESMTGECGAIVRELGLEEEMNKAGFPMKFGVTVAGPAGNSDWWVPVMRREDDELVPAHTWQVRRSIFDQLLLDTAVNRGAELIQATAEEPIVNEAGKLIGVRFVDETGNSFDIHADITFDCTGLASFLANKQITGPKYRGCYDKQVAIFAQVDDYQRDAGKTADLQPGNTHIYYTSKYHWAWAIPIDDSTTSVGIVTPASYFKSSGKKLDDYLTAQIKQLNPGLANRCSGTLAEHARAIPNYSFQVSKFAGPGFICLGDAHRFVDPIFSFGLHVAMSEAGLAADVAVSYLNGEGQESNDPFRNYMVEVESGIDRVEDMIDFFWENPFAFAFLVNNRYREPSIDLFAGRIYAEQPNNGREAAVASFRKVLKRERRYDNELMSVPIGSRYDPTRAPLWNTDSSIVETTEKWITATG